MSDAACALCGTTDPDHFDADTSTRLCWQCWVGEAENPEHRILPDGGRRRTRIIVYGPSDREAGLAVSWDRDPGPHETKFRIEQLWPPAEGEETGRAEPVYVGGQQQCASLIEALGAALQMDLEVEVDRDA